MIETTAVIKDNAIKYLTAFQLVVAILFYTVNTYGFDTPYKIILCLGLIALAGFVYKKDKDIKATLKELDLTPQQELTIKKAIALIQEIFEVTNKFVPPKEPEPKEQPIIVEAIEVEPEKPPETEKERLLRKIEELEKDG